MSKNINAAASASTSHITDFNPALAAFAQSLAAASNTNAHLINKVFTDFYTCKDLTVYDTISLHSIWSWISDKNRAVIVEFIPKKPKVGGVLHISYNTLTGWVEMVPIWGLLTKHSEVMRVEGQGIVKLVNGTLKFADKLLATKPNHHI